MNILIYGFGRMGITHYSILNSLLENSNFTFIEPNKKLSFLVKKNIDSKFFKSDNLIEDKFDLTLITTPPFIHHELIQNCINRGDSTIFVEKPFGGHREHNTDYDFRNLFVGYVLRHNPIVTWVKKNINSRDVSEINAKYLSNTIENKPKGWRNGAYSGVLNEMGSHLIDLTNFLFDINDFTVHSSEIKSHISDVDDEVKASVYSKNRKINFYFNWVDKSIRKPIFEFSIRMKDGSNIIFDQQKLVMLNKNKIINKISVSDLAQTVPYYLRGIDFTNQMVDLIGHQKVISDSQDAQLVNIIMNKILKK